MLNALLELPPAPEMVVIGGSLGALDALGVLLPKVTPGTTAAVVVLVHLPPGRPSLLPDLFRTRLEIPVGEAEDKQPVEGGTIWFAPADYHLSIESDRCFSLSVEPPVRYSRPSIDVLFESAADVYGARLVAIVLTGANDDGAIGARAVRAAGGFVIVQEPHGAVADRMPLAAIAMADPQLVASLERIAESLQSLTGDAA
ncbi:MAG TPA: chemotaxis protein CheB [Polyangiaceae bacterium]|jgi:two-component system chemotaxis response regulator CheB|nr:chemotaxis protein CheB [Polyangiaceae bacterium]